MRYEEEEEGEGWPEMRGRHVHGRGRRRAFGPMGPPGPWMGDPREMREALRGTLRGPRVKRGDVRAAALALLTEGPRNGYQIIQEIGERSGGVWRVSPGSVYPALQQLRDEGLIRAQEPAEGSRVTYQLTDEGRSYAEANAAALAAPWDAVAGRVGDTAIELSRLTKQVGMAAMQVLTAGSPPQIERARQLLMETRRGLYRILAEDAEEDGGAAAQPEG